MITVRGTRGRLADASVPSARPAAGRRTTSQPLWSSDGVLWGVVREEGCFDMHDVTRHRDLVQHAFPLGRDWLAACGFRTPLQRAFDGVRRPLLAMPGVRNPRCEDCLGLIVPAVVPDLRPEGQVTAPMSPSDWILRRLDPPTPSGVDPRPLRPAIPIPVDTPRPAAAAVRPMPSADAAGWPVTDRKPILVDERLRVIEEWRRTAHPLEPTMDVQHMETAGPVGRRAFMEVDRAERIRR